MEDEQFRRDLERYSEPLHSVMAACLYGAGFFKYLESRKIWKDLRKSVFERVRNSSEYAKINDFGLMGREYVLEMFRVAPPPLRSNLLYLVRTHVGEDAVDLEKGHITPEAVNYLVFDRQKLLMGGALTQAVREDEEEVDGPLREMAHNHRLLTRTINFGPEYTRLVETDPETVFFGHVAFALVDLELGRLDPKEVARIYREALGK